MGTERRSNIIGGEEVFNRQELEQKSLDSIKLFLELGLNFFDTAWSFECNSAPCHSFTGSLCRDTSSETILGYAASRYGRNKFILATKFHLEADGEVQSTFSDTFPLGKQLSSNQTFQCTESYDSQSISGHYSVVDKFIRRQLAASLKSLGTDFIDLYYMQTTDLQGETMIVEVMHCLKALVLEKKINYVGLSVNSADTIRRSHAIYPLTAIFADYSFQYRRIEIDVLSTCRELGIGIVARHPYGEGPNSSDRLLWRGSDTRASTDKKVKKSTSQLIDLATEKKCTPNQLALGWLHAQGIDVFPLIETNATEKITEAFHALKIHLYGTDVEEIGTLRL